MNGMSMWGRIGRLSVAVLCCAGVFATAASATTAPGVLNHIKITITNTAIDIPRDQFVKKDGITRYPRGAEIEFTLVNKGSVPIAVRIKALGKVKYTIGQKTLAGSASAGKPIAPGASRHWTLGFYIRGDYEMDSLIHGKVAVKKPIIIF
jgi:hypothetical protein